MLTSGRFWVGFIGGVGAVYAFNAYAVKRASR